MSVGSKVSSAQAKVAADRRMSRDFRFMMEVADSKWGQKNGF
jgi:hypothetical protein